MTFAPGKLDEFLTIFDASKEKIRAFEGCTDLQLMQHDKYPNILFTYSLWRSPEDLERYRHSDLFQSTWLKTKKLFAAKAEAWSTEVLRKL